MAKTKNGVKIDVQKPKLSNHVTLFTALSIIILAFFILLNTFATMDDERRKEAIQSINFQFLGIYEKTRALFKMFEFQQRPVQVSEGEKTFPGDDLMFNMLRDNYDSYSTLGQYASEYGMGGSLGLMVTSRGLVITIPQDLTFPPASAELSVVGQGFLDKLVEIIAPFQNEILIEGHTDVGSTTGSEYRSNWDLSQKRAIAVLRYLMDRGIDINRLSASGCSSYRPIADNTTPENRALNRRVEIIIKHPRLKEPYFGSR